jgi:DNA-binding transcriptional regulator YdaS (Cro superfamily)
MTPLERAVEIAGGQAALARKIGGRVRQQHIYYWLRHEVPAKYCVDIERATGISRYELRPDIAQIFSTRKRRLEARA